MAQYSTADWQIKDAGAGTISAVHSVTKETFSGTVAQFNTKMQGDAPSFGNAETGRGGVVNTQNTTQVIGGFSSIQVLSDAVFSEFTELSATGVITGISIPAGVILYGVISSYTLTSGVVRAYKG